MNKQFDLSVSNYGTTADVYYDIAILPWGATEPHNLHLPYLTDAILSHDVAVDAAVKAHELHGIHAMVLPPITLGQQNPGQLELPFCIHTRYETQKAILTDIVYSLAYQGITKLLIVNGHGGNSFKSMIRDIYLDYPQMRIALTDWYKVLPAKDYFDNPGDHADELETSVMMHYHPELVNLEEAGPGISGGFAPKTLADGVAWLPRDWYRVSRDTGIGSPALASAEKGAKYAEDVTRLYADLLLDLTKENLYKPLEQ